MRRRPSVGTVLGAVALFVALGGPAEAVKLIDGSRIRKGSIPARAIKPHALTGRLIKAASIGGDRLVDRSVTLAKLSPAAVTLLTATPDNAITGATVLDRSLSGADLGDETLGRSQIAAEGVAGSEIADGRQTVADLASWAGTATIDPGPLSAGKCQAIEQPARVVWQRSGVTLEDDAVFVAAPEGFGDQFVLTARPSGTSSIRFVVCNVSSSTQPADPPPVTVRYLTIEF